MMGDLFSGLNMMFSSFYIPLKWVTLLMIVILIPQKFWVFPSRMETLIKMIMINTPAKLFYLIPMMIMISISNWTGLIPYLFSISPHILVIFSMAFPIWLSMEISRVKKNISLRIAELLPKNVPSYLIPLIIPVELVSLMIRPFTLILRLSVNMMSGALIVNVVSIGVWVMPSLIPSLLILQMLEIMVCMIQGYVFITLINLYQKS